MIRVSNLVKKFGDLKAVDDVSFEVAEGEIFAFLGPKRRRQDHHHQDAHHPAQAHRRHGRIDGLDPATHQNDVRQRFGIVFQDPSLDDELTAWENMDFHGVLYNVPGKLRSERTEELLKLVRALGPPGRSGQAVLRRHEAAAGNRPRPAAHAQDPFPGRAHAGPRSADPQPVWSHVQKLNEEERITVFLTTHYMEEADRVAHRIAIIDHGRSWRRARRRN